MSALELFPDPTDAPDAVRVVAAGLRRLAARSGALRDEVRRATATLGPTWKGPAARACRSELASVAALIGAVAGPLRGAGQALEVYAEAVAKAAAAVAAVRQAYDADVMAQQTEMRHLVADLEPSLAHDLFVADLWSRQRAQLDRHGHRYVEICADLRAAARSTGRRLDSLAAQVVPGAAAGASTGAASTGMAATGMASTGMASVSPVLVLEGSLATLLPMLASARSAVGTSAAGPSAAGTAGALPPIGSPPASVHRWWSLLTTNERSRLLTARPDAMGSLDGLPAAARSAANETVLRRLLAGLARPGGIPLGRGPEVVNALAVAAQLARVRRSTDPVTRRPVTAHLLVFAPEAFGGQGRAAIAVGDLDAADNVALIVPGLNATLRNSWSGLVTAATRVTSAGRRADPARTTATVAWLGYDAPDVVSVTGPGSAERGADLLERDLVGLRGARPTAPHLTLIGHSYGSTTAGVALREGAAGVTDAVFLGSPGATVDRVSRLHLPGGHVFVGSASRDPVSYLDRFGRDPSHASFGATRFRAEDPRRDPWMMDLRDHLRYFDPGGESLANVARIVVGDYADVTRAAYRHEMPLFPDGIMLDPEAYREPLPDG